MKIVKLFHGESDEFWLLLGPVFASSRIGAEFINDPITIDGAPRLFTSLVSEPGFVWWTAIGDNTLRGFCSAENVSSNGVVWTGYTYVYPEFRGRGIFRQLFMERLLYLKSLPGVKQINSHYNLLSKAIFIENGFCLDKQGATAKYDL